MPDFVKSEEQFKRENFPYPKPQEQIGHELWLSKVTNPSTGTDYQLSYLPTENRHITPLLASESHRKRWESSNLSYQTCIADGKGTSS